MHIYASMVGKGLTQGTVLRIHADGETSCHHGSVYHQIFLCNLDIVYKKFPPCCSL